MHKDVYIETEINVAYGSGGSNGLIQPWPIRSVSGTCEEFCMG